MTGLRIASPRSHRFPDGGSIARSIVPRQSIRNSEIADRLTMQAGHVIGQTKRRPAGAGLVAALFALLVVEIVMGLLPNSQLRLAAGHDWQTYQDAALRFLSGHGFYSDYQLAGPYTLVEREVMYPPVVVLLLVPFALLPTILWFAVPIGIVGWILWKQKPSLARWAVILALLTLPIHYSTSYSLETLVNGSPTIWIMAFVALATRYPVFGPLALLKPTPAIVPFALVGIRSRSWWIGLGLLAVVSVAFLPMWFDWIGAMRNARMDFAPWAYGLLNVELLLIPLSDHVEAIYRQAVRRRRPEEPTEADPVDRERLAAGRGVRAPHGAVVAEPDAVVRA